MHEEPTGVTPKTSRCGNSGTTAYEIGEAALLTANTITLFPNGFPQDFSILIAAKPKLGKQILNNEINSLVACVFFFFFLNLSS